jgi:phage terminase large subunit
MQVNQFKFKDTTATKKIFKLKKRIRAVCGGTSASKTISILIWCIDYAQSTRDQLISVVSESFPHLSGGAMQDFERIMKDRGYWVEKNWVKNPKTVYTFETGSKIEFLSVDTVGKAHGPRRDVLFINECNNLSFLITDQLIVRTRDVIWMDWNPVNEFWFYTELLGKRDDIDFITLTYKDNEALDENTIKEIESRIGRKNWWKVYGLGQLGEVEGKVYTDWQFIDDIPPEARLERRGLDYGYSNDPTAIISVYKWNNSYIWDEVCYQKGLSNRQIADILLNQENPQTIVVPDSAEPKSNDELVAYGINVLPAHKGRGSVSHGIQVVQSQKIFVTNRSVNIKKEYRNYLWEVDKNGKVLNEPEHGFNHAMDAGRYAMETLNIEVGLSPVEKYMLNEAQRKSGINFSR